MLCGGEPFVSSDPKLKGGYYLSPCVLGNILIFVVSGLASSLTTLTFVCVILAKKVCSILMLMTRC